MGGVAHRGRGFEWVVFDLVTRGSFAYPLETPGLRDLLVYGSIGRDNEGRVYVGGWAADEHAESRKRPVVLQLDPGR